MTMIKYLESHSKLNRQKHNLEIIQRMRTGDTLQRYSAQSSWFPPRPVIKKDPEAIQILYGQKKELVLETGKDAT